MKSLRKTILLTAALLSVGTPAFAKDDAPDDDRSQTNSTQPASEEQDESREEEEDREDSTTTRPERREERREDRREESTTTRPPATGSSTTRPPAPPTTARPSTGSVPPRDGSGTRSSTTAPRLNQEEREDDDARPESDKDLREVLVKITNSSLDASVKESLTQQVQAVINAISAGTASYSDMENVLRSVKAALKGQERRQDAPPTSRDEESEDYEDYEDTYPEGSSPTQGSAARPPRDAEQSRGDLKEKLNEIVEKLNKLAPSAEVDSATASVKALLALLETEQVVSQEQVRQVLDQVRTVASSRLGIGGRQRGSDEPYKAPEQHEQSRIAGAVAEALRHLTGIETPEAESARSALEAIQSQIASNAKIEHDVFESAMDQARLALSTKPGARAAMTLAGVIKRLEDASESTPEREEMINLIRAALEQARLNPDADPNELVKAALEQARALRIAAARVKLLSITERLTLEATAAGNNDLLVILSSVTAELNSPDGTLPTREQLHRLRDTLEDVSAVLHPESADDGEEEPDSSLPEDSTQDPAEVTQPDPLESGVRDPSGSQPDDTLAP